jgi:hypothetical protein
MCQALSNIKGYQYHANNIPGVSPPFLLFGMLAAHPRYSAISPLNTSVCISDK